MAIANRHRHRADVFIGDELAQATLDEIIDRALQDNDYVGQVSVTALIHPENKASKRLCERMGLERTGVADSGYENWSAELFFADWSAITGARGRADTFALSAVVVPTRV
jgi:RimJ/RimL family protein N-acetyltransferase